MRSLVIQAGGQSRRMGQDKALLPFLGQPLIQRGIARLGHLADEILVTTNHPENFTFLGLPLFPDIIPDRGALSGLYTALHASRHDTVLVVACDMPFISPALLGAQADLLEQGYDAVIPLGEGGTEPFHSVYRRSTCLELALAAIQAEKWRVDAWFPQANIHFLNETEIQRLDPSGMSFWNVNTPAEFQRAEAIARQLDQGNNHEPE
ncbi:MAG TPA: molybdenum cofactor guanylyltransferase [Anaerolineales bacterium]|nr:molybdenum cofactor guanylyltransferase [Anaerolineales bacterium]